MPIIQRSSITKNLRKLTIHPNIGMIDMTINAKAVKATPKDCFIPIQHQNTL